MRPEYHPSRISDPNYVRIHDTTLRDGEQAPGAAMTCQQKLAVAVQLARLGVDIIEAGFPTSSPADFESVRLIAEHVGNPNKHDLGHPTHVPVICAFARCTKSDVDVAWEAVRHAASPRLLLFIATSNVHMRHKLRMERHEVVARAAEMVAYAKAIGCDDIMFGTEDAARSDREFLYHIYEEVIKAGATTIGVADTVGCCSPQYFGTLVADIKANTARIDNVVICVHCHNDLGLATANTLAGALAGARQVDVTMNGIGERAGNTALEEVVMAMKSLKDHYGGIYTGIDTTQIIATSKLVEEYSGLHVQPHKAIVGANAFVHESGIHQDGILKERSTYEIIDPSDVGLVRSHKLGIVLGRHSGRNALKMKLEQLECCITGADFDSIFRRFKEIAGSKKVVTDEEVMALVADPTPLPPREHSVWPLVDLQVSAAPGSKRLH